MDEVMTLILFFIALLVAFTVGYEVGRDKANEVGKMLEDSRGCAICIEEVEA